jgi:hypothetical protein
MGSTDDVIRLNHFTFDHHVTRLVDFFRTVTAAAS